MRKADCPRRPRFQLAASLAGLIVALTASTQAQGPTNLGDVGARTYQPSQVAVPPFEGRGAQAGQPDTIIGRTVSRDLMLSGFFREPENTGFVAEAIALDKGHDPINYAEWFKIGCSYVVKGSYEHIGDKVECEVRVYDTSAQKYMFGKLYKDYPRDNPRKLAHYICNDIVQSITSNPGFAHTQFVYIGETSVSKGQMSKEVFMMDADGENATQVTNDRNLSATPAWGARGTEIYFTTYKDYNPDLMGMILKTKYNWFVSRRSGFNLSPDWCETRQQIALTLSRDGNSEIYIINREGKDLKRMTFTKSIDSSPCWSPDGSRIAFTSDRTGNPQLYIMDNSGTNVRRLTTRGAYNDGAAWRTQGDMIAFSSRIDGTFQIFTISPNGENLRQLTNNSWNSEDPCWSPNGQVIAFTSDKTGHKQIYTMFNDGRLLAQISRGRSCFSSDWSPIGQ